MKIMNWAVTSWRRLLYSYAEQYDWILLLLYETKCLEGYLIIHRKDLYLNYLRELAEMNGNTDRLRTIETDNDMVDICRLYQEKFYSKIEWEELMYGIFHNQKLGLLNVTTLPGTALMRHVTTVKLTSAGEIEAKQLMVWDKKSSAKKASDLLRLHSGSLAMLAILISIIALFR